MIKDREKPEESEETQQEGMPQEGRRLSGRLVGRLLLYLLGILVLALGITLNTKTNLGVSPIISVAYCVSGITGIKLAVTTFVWYILMIFMQAVMLGRNFKPLQLLQVGVSFLTSWFIGIFDGILPVAESMAVRIFLLLLAIVITSIGIILTVGMKVVPNPADGFASVLGEKLGRGLGFGKNVFDLSSIVISTVLGLAIGGRLIGIGIGTVLTMILTGRVVAFISRFTAEPCRRMVEGNRLEGEGKR
jgi:uncharacterized membrane protein YczE